MKVYNDLLWVAFATIWLLILVVGLVTAVDGGSDLGFWGGLRLEHRTLLNTAMFITGARLMASYLTWKRKNDTSR